MTKLLRFVQVIVGVALFQMSGPTYADSTCTLKQVGEIPVTSDEKTGQPLVKLIAGDQTLTLVVDTEAPFSALSREAAARVGGKMRSMDGVGIGLKSGNKTVKSYAKVKDITIGRAKMTGFDFPVLPDGLPPRDNDGFIGVDFLNSFDVEFDFLNGRMILYTHFDCSGRSPVYWTDGFGDVDLIQNQFNYIIFNTVLNGSDVPTILGTAYRLTAMPRGIAGSRFGIRPAAAEIACAKDAQHGDNFAQLDVGGLSIRNPEINSDCDNPLCPTAETVTPQLGIGMNHLKRLRIFVAWKLHKIYFSPAVAAS